MLAMEDEKLPPAPPAVAAQPSSTQTCTLWVWWSSQPLGTTRASSRVGTNNRTTLTVVHARPPYLGTAKVYGIRSRDPTRLGTSVSRNSSETDREIPWLARLSTTMVQSTHTLKPMCSASIERARFFLAIVAPVRSQNSSSSGSQRSIQ